MGGRVKRYFLKKAFAARWLRSKSEIYNLVATGNLPAMRVGTGRGTIRIRQVDIEKFERKMRRDDLKVVAEHFG